MKQNLGYLLHKISCTTIHKLVTISLLGKDTGAHLTRYYMYQRLAATFTGDKDPDLKILSISDSQGIINAIGLKNSTITNACYPEYDMLCLPFEDDSFDIVVSDQVLEHILGDPHVAIKEVYRVLRKGGIAAHTTCMMNPIHEHPVDMWRFTPSCLAYLHKYWSEIIECGGWGNQIAFLLMIMGFRMIPIPRSRWHLINKIATMNQPDFPIVTWIVAKK